MPANTAPPRTTRKPADIVVVGGGIVGLTSALEDAKRHPDSCIVVLEKDDVGAHASGRNSGVLHAGFYYTADSLKARFSVEGNRRLTEYCLERGLRINRCGKLVVAPDPADQPGLDELLGRGKVNGVEVEEVTVAEAKELEPRCRTLERALWSPTTSSVDPEEVVKALASDAEAAGVEVRTGTRYLSYDGREVRTDRGMIGAGYLINAAGAYADRVARLLGFSQRYRILPLKGMYLYSDEPPGAFRRHLYPVPHLGHPFLGVHTTITVDGRVKIGPNAMPALGREHYGGLAGVRPWEMTKILAREAALFVRNVGGFRDMAKVEISKRRRKVMVRHARRLAEGIRLEDYRRWGTPGIRAQLVDMETGELVMDFAVEGDDRSFHVLNAVSPAFTCAFPFAEHVWERLASLA